MTDTVDADIYCVLDADELYAAWEVVAPLREVWRNMLRRCENPASPDYERYGGRGIQVCPAWHDFRQFLRDVLKDIGPRPAGTYPRGKRGSYPKYTLDRANNDGHYEPGNIRWATVKEQNDNRRSRRKGEVLPGQQFGWLVVLREVRVSVGSRGWLSRAAEVRCTSCGGERTVLLGNLRKAALAEGRYRSCRCQVKGGVS